MYFRTITLLAAMFRAITLFAAILLALCTPVELDAFDSDGFVSVSGDQFVLSSNPGHTFKAKGFNYFPQRHPWAIFSEWDPVEVNAELAIASQMNSNVVRTFVTGGVYPGQGVVNAIVEFVQICKANKQKAIISLFDGYHGYPAAGTQEEANNFALIDALAGALKNDTGVFAWDVKNEPDWINSSLWSWSLPGAEAEGARRIDWLFRMRNRLKQVAPNHLVTVGLIFNYNNYLPAGTRTVESFVDFVCYHYYPRNYPFETFRESIQSLKARTSKPINVEEIGHNAHGGAGATEQDQANLFLQWLSDIAAENISGLVQWTLCDWWDQWPGPEDERYYGFIRADGNYSWKPAAFVYRDNFHVEQFDFTLQQATVQGTVLDVAGNPVASARIAIEPGGYSVFSGADGSYWLSGLAQGVYTATASAEGYVSATVTDLVLQAGQTVDVDFTLHYDIPSEVGLVNAGFETGDLTGWTTWGQVDGVQSGPWFASINAHGGSRFLGTATNGGSKNGGVYQQTAVVPGRSYVVSCWSRTYRISGPEGSVANRVGLDPTGGTDPSSTAIIWSDFTASEQDWEKLRISAHVAGPRLTIFLQHRQTPEGEWDINCFDDVGLHEVVTSAAAAISLEDGWPVTVPGCVVTAAFPGWFYVEDAGRMAGLRIMSSASVSEGDTVDVTGAMGSWVGERQIVAEEVAVIGDDVVPEPLVLTLRAVGGVLSGQEPIEGATGLYNSGLLIRTAGRVILVGDEHFYVDDGSGVFDGYHQGVRVAAATAWAPPVSSVVTVTGISTRQRLAGEPARAIRVRRASDIVAH